MTPRARGAGSSFSCGYCTVTAPLEGDGIGVERAPFGNIVLTTSLHRDAEALDEAEPFTFGSGHQNTTFRTMVTTMLTSDERDEDLQAKRCELVLTEAGIGEPDPEDDDAEER